MCVKHCQACTDLILHRFSKDLVQKPFPSSFGHICGSIWDHSGTTWTPNSTNMWYHFGVLFRYLKAGGFSVPCHPRPPPRDGIGEITLTHHFEGNPLLKGPSAGHSGGRLGLKAWCLQLWARSLTISSKHKGGYI